MGHFVRAPTLASHHGNCRGIWLCWRRWRGACITSTWILADGVHTCSVQVVNPTSGFVHLCRTKLRVHSYQGTHWGTDMLDSNSKTTNSAVLRACFSPTQAMSWVIVPAPGGKETGKRTWKLCSQPSNTQLKGRKGRWLSPEQSQFWVCYAQARGFIHSQSWGKLPAPPIWKENNFLWTEKWEVRTDIRDTMSPTYLAAKGALRIKTWAPLSPALTVMYLG